MTGDGGRGAARLSDELLPEMPCQELVEVVTDHLEGQQTPRDRRRFDLHLAECPACRRYLEQVVCTLGLLARMPRPGLPTTSREAILRAFRERT